MGIPITDLGMITRDGPTSTAVEWVITHFNLVWL